MGGELRAMAARGGGLVTCAWSGAARPRARPGLVTGGAEVQPKSHGSAGTRVAEGAEVQPKSRFRNPICDFGCT